MQSAADGRCRDDASACRLREIQLTVLHKESYKLLFILIAGLAGREISSPASRKHREKGRSTAHQSEHCRPAHAFRSYTLEESSVQGQCASDRVRVALASSSSLSAEEAGEGNQVICLQLIRTEVRNRGRCRHVERMSGLPCPGSSPRWDSHIPSRRAAGTNR